MVTSGQAIGYGYLRRLASQRKIPSHDQLLQIDELFSLRRLDNNPERSIFKR